MNQNHTWDSETGEHCLVCGCDGADAMAGQSCGEKHAHEWSGFGDDGNAPCYCLICGVSGDV